MGKHPRVFNDLFVSMVRPAKSRKPGGVLERVAIQLEKDDNLKRTVKSAMVYPIMIGAFALLILVAMILFFIPVFKKMFDDLGGKLPALTQFMIDLSDAGRSRCTCSSSAASGWCNGFQRWKPARRDRLQWDTIKLRFPMQIGDIVRKIAVARFTPHARDAHTASGVPILQALDITARTAGNRVISDPMDRVVERVKEGESSRGRWRRSGVPDDGHPDGRRGRGDRRT